MDRSEAGAGGEDMVSLGPGDGGHGVDYEFEELDEGSLGFVGADKVQELKRDVRKAWEEKGEGHFSLHPTSVSMWYCALSHVLGMSLQRKSHLHLGATPRSTTTPKTCSPMPPWRRPLLNSC